VTRADRDGDPGRGKTGREPEAERARRADDRDGALRRRHRGAAYTVAGAGSLVPSSASKRASAGNANSTMPTPAMQATPPLTTAKRAELSAATVPDSMSPRRTPPVTTRPKTDIMRP